MRRIITLLTDFGLRDYFVAEMKGVILSINPNVEIVDISHDVEKFDVVQGAFLLVCAYKWFPKGTIHVVVVDPGVGTERKPIVIKTRNYYFVGPDNGVLSASAIKDGVEEVYEIEVRETSEVSTTFHGRDIFAPIAAYISLGKDLSSLGRKIDRFIILDLFKVSTFKGAIKGAVIHVDSFGNVITSIEREHLGKVNINYGDALEVLIGNVNVNVKLLPAYGYVKPGELLAIVNSEGFLEIAANMSNAASRLGVGVGDEVVVRKI